MSNNSVAYSEAYGRLEFLKFTKVVVCFFAGAN